MMHNKISQMPHPLHASHIPTTGQAGGVLTKRLRYKDKQAQPFKGTYKLVHILLRTKLEWVWHNLLLILLVKAQSERRWELPNNTVKVKVTGTGRVEYWIHFCILLFHIDEVTVNPGLPRKVPVYSCYFYRTIDSMPPYSKKFLQFE